MGLDIDEEMDEEEPVDGYDLLRSLDAATEHLSPSVHLARRTGIDSHRVQLMKASLFDENSTFPFVKRNLKKLVNSLVSFLIFERFRFRR